MASITKDPSGSYRARYRTPDGKSRSKSFPLKRDAVKFLAEMETSKTRGAFVDPNRSKMTVKAWAERWLDGKVNLTQTTRDRYSSIITAHIEPRWAGHRLAEVQHSDVQKWVSELTETHAAATVTKIHRVFSQILGSAVKDGRLGRNPAAGINLPRIREPEKRFLTHGQVEELADACGQVFPPYALIVRFLAYTGLRWGEMAALRAGRLDWLRKRALIRESVTETTKGLDWGATKGHITREVPIPTFLIDELSEYVEGLRPDALVFTAPFGGVVRPQHFQRQALNAAAEALGHADDTGETDDNGQPIYANHFTPHELRHTAASLAIAAGADVKVVQTMLGHKSATMTLDQYGHLFGDRLDTVADAMATARTKALAENPVSDSCQTGVVVRFRARN